MRMPSLVLAVCCAVVSGAAWAQSYPLDKPLRLVVGFAPGGSSDILARLLAARLTDALGQRVVVENRPGASGNLAAETVAKAAPDGHSLLLGSTSTNAVNPSLYPKLPFDAVKDLTAVTLVATGANALVIHPSVPARNVRDLIALAKARPGKLTYASAGSGSSMHLQAELFKQMAGVDILHVPYKGAAPAVTDLLSGQVDIAFAAVVSVVPYAKEGKLKLLGITGAERSFFSPDTPTIAESGLPGYDMTTWYGIFVTSGTSTDIVNRLHEQLRKIALSPQIKEQLASAGFEPAASASPAEFRAFQLKEIEKWGRLVRSIGLKVE